MRLRGAVRTGTGPVAVLEIDPYGHRLRYVRHIAGALGPGRCLVLTSPAALAAEEFAAHLPELRETAVVLPGTDSRSEVLAAAMRGALDRGAATLVVPDGDQYVLPLLRLLWRRPWLRLRIRLLLMRTPAVLGPEHLRPATLVKPVLVQLLRLFPQVSVLFLTDALGVVRRRPGFSGIRPVRDPALPDPQPARARPAWLPAPTGGVTVVGVFGVICMRKNVPLLVAAAQRVDSTVLVVAGRMEAPVRAYLDGDPAARRLASAGRLVVVDRLLDPDELAAGLAHVDLVGVLHDNDSPSGILAEACLRHTPVLVLTGGWLARVVLSTGIGATTDPTPEAVAAAIHALTRDRDRYVAATRLSATRINVDHFATHLAGSCGDAKRRGPRPATDPRR